MHILKEDQVWQSSRFKAADVPNQIMTLGSTPSLPQGLYSALTLGAGRIYWLTFDKCIAAYRFLSIWLACLRVKKLRAARLLEEAMRLDELARTKSEEEQRAFAEMYRRIHPDLKADFAILHTELAAWVASVSSRSCALHCFSASRLHSLAALAGCLVSIGKAGLHQ